MAEDYTQEQLKELYGQLPEKLKKAVFSTEIGHLTQKTLASIDISDAALIQIVLKKIGYVFLGILPPEELKRDIQEELKISEKQTEDVYNKIYNDVFLDLKTELEALYQIKLRKKLLPKALPESPKPKKTDRYLEEF